MYELGAAKLVCWEDDGMIDVVKVESKSVDVGNVVGGDVTEIWIAAEV